MLLFRVLWFHLGSTIWFSLAYPLLLFFVKLLSHVQLFATLWTVGHQVPLSMGFSRQEYWNGLLFPASGALPDPGVKPKSPALGNGFFTTETPGKPIADPAAAKSLQSFPTLRNPMVCSPPGSSIHGIFQARVLEWGAIAFSDSWFCCCCC